MRRVCCICGEIIEQDPVSGYCDGHDAAPVVNGRCCIHCNYKEVLPTRLYHLRHDGNPTSDWKENIYQTVFEGMYLQELARWDQSDQQKED